MSGFGLGGGTPGLGIRFDFALDFAFGFAFGTSLSPSGGGSGGALEGFAELEFGVSVALGHLGGVGFAFASGGRSGTGGLGLGGSFFACGGDLKGGALTGASFHEDGNCGGGGFGTSLPHTLDL